MGTLFLLSENASGYCILEKLRSDEGWSAAESYSSSSEFSRCVKFISYLPFKNQEEALSNLSQINEGIIPPLLQEFLLLNLPKISKHKSSSNYSLGLSDEKLGSAIHESLGIPCKKNPSVLELLRGINTHLIALSKGQIKQEDLDKARLGLGHAFSRSKVQFNANRADNCITQGISLLDQLEKDLNTFSMRLREWYGWHFPELMRLVPDMCAYASVVLLIGQKESLPADETKIQELANLLKDANLGGDDGEGIPKLAQDIVDASKTSIGGPISEIDIEGVLMLASRVVDLWKYSKELGEYLKGRMLDVAPNLSTLIGHQVGARLICQAGSLTNLAKYPASTVQILGAEKALFRALKKRGNTPKYGILFHSGFIGKASAPNKGKISRYVANKCSMASRIDCFREGGVEGSISTPFFGEAMKQQTEERLDFYEGRSDQNIHNMKKNIDVMKECMLAEEKEREEIVSQMEIEDEEQLDKSPKRQRESEQEGSTKKKRKTKHKQEDLRMESEIIPEQVSKEEDDEEMRKRKEERRARKRERKERRRMEKEKLEQKKAERKKRKEEKRKKKKKKLKKGKE